MALSTAEKVDIKRHLGLNSANEAWYPWVQAFFTADRILETLPTDTEDAARTILNRLTTLEADLDGTAARMKVSGLGPIKMNPVETDKLWTEIRRWRNELSILLGLPNMRRTRLVVA